MAETTRLSLRDYQAEAIEAVEQAWSRGMRRPGVVLPCGAGKTVIFARIASDFIAARPRERVLVIVHRDELAGQTLEKLRSTDPDLRVGKVKAGDNEVGASVVVASVQTASRPNRLAQLVASQQRYGPFRRIITDEVHLAAVPSYWRIYDAFPEALHLGVTATLARGDGRGLGREVDEVVYTRSVLWMISRGYLCDVRGADVTADGLDLDAVKRSGRDYRAGDLGAAMIESGANKVMAHAYRQHAADRPGIAFTPDVASAYDAAKELENRGVTSAVVTGETPLDERARIYTASRTGAVQVICNCAVLTTGTDFPWISCIVPRATKSETLWIQMAGRGLRTWPGKRDALILSVAGATGKIRTLVDLAPGQVPDVRPGETLAEAAVREEERRESRVRAGSLAFSLKHRDMDLFAAASQNWLTTDAGVLFIPVARSFLFLWPREDGTWDVGGAPPAGPWQRLRTGLPLGTAQAWAETFADERSPVRSDTSASWRRKAPSPGVRAAARSMGIDVPDSWRAGDVSDAIAVRAASRKFDDRMTRSTATR